MSRWHAIFEGQTQELSDVLARVSSAELDALAEAIRSAPRVFVGGRGRSGFAMQGFAMRLMHLGKCTCLLGETTTPAVGPGDLVLIGSGSGATASLVSAAETAVGVGASVALVTIDPDSPIGRLAAVTVRVPAPSPKAAGGGAMASIQPMGTLFEQALGLLCDAVVLQLMDDLKMSDDAMFARHANIE